MSKLQIRIHNLETDEIIDREMTDEEFVKHEAKIAAISAEETLAATKATEKQAILDQLGITEEQAKLLLS